MSTIFIYLLFIYLAGACFSLVLQRNAHIAHLVQSSFAIAGSAVGLGFGMYLLLTKSFFSFIIPTSVSLFTVSIHVDALSAFFIVIISLIALASTVYGLGYMKHYYDTYQIGVFGFFYNLFILSLLLVATAYNSLYFIFVWEIMSLSSLFLVMFEHKKAENIQAGYVYFIMTHVATACIFFAFLILYQATGSFDFGTIRQLSGIVPPLLKDIVFVLFLIGFGTKAGIIPFHIWLPRAHSAAPSHVSALMSGVMIKMGIFMLFRFFIDILPHSPLWWGLVILVIGAISSVVGVLHALSEHDSKRLLAYHSIENIGIILLGLGSGMIFLNLGNISLAILAFTAGLFHTINHALFKALLFLGAGSVISQTHTRNLEEYGGLIKRMPYTALFFLVGALAISGLPPFNGFVSEWLTFQSLFGGVALDSMFLKSIFIFVGGSLALTGGLAAACFVKAFGITFLARPRSKHAEHAKESSRFMITSMGFLAFICLGLGVFPFLLLPILHNIVVSLATFNPLATSVVVSTIFVHINSGFAVLSMPILFLFLCLTIMAGWIFTHLLSRKQKVRISEIWDCGYNSVTPRMEITATGFSRSLIMIFKGIFQPTKQHDVEYVDANIRYFSSSRTVTLGIVNIYEAYFYRPFHKGLQRLSLYIRQVQTGSVNQYVSYIFIALLGLLMWVRFH